jgi:hypothetical protein
MRPTHCLVDRQTIRELELIDLISDARPFGRFMSDNKLELNAAEVFQLVLARPEGLIGAWARLLRRMP